jgi:uncharacterized protein (TIGR02594 family)
MTALIEAGRKYLGQREVPGPGVNAWIKNLWGGLPGGKWFWDSYGQDDSKLPWCGAFVARCCQDAGIELPKQYASALAWIKWGELAGGPRLGAVAVLTRQGGGHVGIVTGISESKELVRLLGGNQGDGVTEAWFSINRVTSWRQPVGASLPPATIAKVGDMSRSEA